MPITGTAYVPSVAPGVYQAVCTDCQEKAAKKDPTNIFRVWEFSLPDGRTVGASSSLSTTPKSKGGKWIAAMKGSPLEIGEVYEPIGQRCTIIVALNDEGYEYVETVAAPQDAAPAPSPSYAQTVAPTPREFDDKRVDPETGKLLTDDLPF